MIELKDGYKNSKVGVIPDHWDCVKLEEIATFHKGKGISKSDISNNGTDCIRYGELYTKYNEKIKKIISKTNIPIEQLFLSKSNDILIPASGETAIDLATASCVLKDNIGLGGDINVIRTEINGIFLSYYLNTIAKTNIARLAQGISVIHLYSSQLKNLSISYPIKKEQNKIVEILTTWDEAIVKLEKLIKLKERRKKGLMQQLLSGKKRLGGFLGEWDEVRLGDVAKITMGQSPSSHSYNDQKKGIPLIQGNADCKNRQTRPRIYTTEITKRCFIGDIIMTVRAPVGAISKSLHNACIGRGVCSIKSNYENEYLYHFLVNFEEFWNKYSQGSTFEAVNSNDIKNLIVPCPDLEEQEIIALILSTTDKEIFILNNKLEALRLQKKGLMQKLLTGTVRAKV